MLSRKTLFTFNKLQHKWHSSPIKTRHSTFMTSPLWLKILNILKQLKKKTLLEQHLLKDKKFLFTTVDEVGPPSLFLTWMRHWTLLFRHFFYIPCYQKSVTRCPLRPGFSSLCFLHLYDERGRMTDLSQRFGVTSVRLVFSETQPFISTLKSLRSHRSHGLSSLTLPSSLETSRHVPRRLRSRLQAGPCTYTPLKGSVSPLVIFFRPSFWRLERNRSVIKQGLSVSPLWNTVLRTQTHPSLP